MTLQERKNFRPETVKRNILGCVKAIRGTEATIEIFEGNTEQLEAYVRSCKKQIAQFWAERKLNKWTN